MELLNDPKVPTDHGRMLLPLFHRIIDFLRIIKLLYAHTWGSGPNPAPRAGIIMCFTVTRGGVKSCFRAVCRESRFARYQGHRHELPLVRGVGSEGW